MRRSLAVIGALTSLAATAAVVACVDLFHSTGDIQTACELDGATPGCVNEAAADVVVEAGPTDFCAWSPAVARQHATHACAWLGACETPLGRNAFGSCMFQALLAYDCAANPDHPARNKAHALWDCLWQAKSCKDVDACVFPQGTQNCNASNFVQCSTVKGNSDVRVECSQAGTNTHGENCALWGQTCVNTSGVEAICAGDPMGSSCTSSACSGSSLVRWCSDAGTNVGIDCASNGGQACAMQGSGDAAVPVCAPSSDGGACAADASASCVAGKATSCADGVLEHIDCASLLGAAADASTSACSPGPLSPPFDWSSACVQTPPSCTQDSCSQGRILTGCWRGASYTVDCSQEVGTACGQQTTDRGAVTNAACGHP